MVNAEKWGAKINKWWATNLLLPNFYVLSALSSQLSVFSKLCIMNTLLHFLLLCQLCRNLRNVSLVGRILGLIKSYYHDWLSMMTSDVVETATSGTETETWLKFRDETETLS